jgi:hypothetical protein
MSEFKDKVNKFHESKRKEARNGIFRELRAELFGSAHNSIILPLLNKLKNDPSNKTII